ncbi:MAG: Flagellar biosynthesis protein FliO [Candidatus Hydrogenedentota bacterium]|jgi:flagellar biogenesis protein FliO
MCGRTIAALLAMMLCSFPAAATQTDGGTPEEAVATETPDAQTAAPAPSASAEDDIDMTAFQEAYDREVARTQAEETGAPMPQDAPVRDTGIGTMALRSAAALLGICGAIILLGWAARRFGGKTPMLAGAGIAQVLGRTYLEPKVALHFVKTGGRVLVVGVTPQTIALISEFDAADFEASPAIAELPKPATGAADFLSRLKEQQAASATPPVADEDLEALRGDIQRLKQFLQESRRGGQ